MPEIFNLNFVIPTILSIIALYYSRKFNKRLLFIENESNKRDQRSEIYQYYPMITISSEVEGKKIKLLIRNDSSSNASSKSTIIFLLRISFHNKTSYSFEDEWTLELPPLDPKCKIEIYPEEANLKLNEDYSTIFRASNDKEFVFVTTINYKSSHPESKTLQRKNISFFKVKNDFLNKIKEENESYDL